jgi:dipeptidyl aminopeptidase/acylaminoacyl peptidase
VLEPNGSGRVVRARGPAGGFEGADLLEPRAVSWKSQNATVHGLLYRPRDAARAPMIVHVHGGPTGQAIVDWNARIQYLCSRGWTVLSVNHRGSTGYGREYLRALDGEWGEHDVADVASGIRHAVKEGWADPDRVAVTGGSAGGFTALLCAARHPGLVAAVAVLYPVTDLFDLAETTYRFESGYCDRLVGPLPEAAGTYRRRSPVAHATAIRAPVLVLQGAQDQAVPPAQAAALVEALRGAGTVVEHHVYDDEGHGFRRAATVADEIERIEGFFARWVLRRRP